LTDDATEIGGDGPGAVIEIGGIPGESAAAR
jgi:hypothetical protein